MIPLPSKPKVTKEGDNKAFFTIEALYPGYGITIGNSLRRVLLSSLEGSAITQVKIEGVQHEFSTIDGVMEDVITIILNLKQLNFRIHEGEPQKGTLKVKGEKDIKAKDLKLPTQVEIINKDAHIASLTKKSAELDMEIQIEKGKGFVQAEDLKEGREEVGQITIDGIFTPVLKVDFSVENMRVGKRTDFDKLIVEVETDGSLTPEEAFMESSKILCSHFSTLKEAFDPGEDKTPTKKGKEKKVDKKKSSTKKKSRGLEELNLPESVIETLKENKIKTIDGLKKKKKEELIEIKGLGEKKVEKIIKEVKRK